MRVLLAVALFLSSPFAFAWSQALPTSPMTFDFDGDGRADLLEQRGDGTVAMTLAAAGTRATIASVPNAFVKAVGDLDGDGRSDILWEGADGSVTGVLMNGTRSMASAQLLAGSSGWSVRLLADFDGDGHQDILWQHTDGSYALWLMNGLRQVGGARLLAAGTGWSVAVVGDFNGDGKADIAWTHTDGRSALWLMDGARQVGGAVLVPAGTGWVPRFAGDFDGDGKADLVWTRTDGSVALWLMAGAAQKGGRLLVQAGTIWTVTGVADFTGDRKADLAWKATDGSAAQWWMDGTTQVGGMRVGGTTTARLAFVGDVQGTGAASWVFYDPNANDGWQVISNLATGAPAPATWTAVELPNLGINRTSALAINGNGVVVGCAYVSATVRHAVSWQDGRITDLGSGTPGTEGSSCATAVSDTGTIAGQSAAGEFVLWKGGQLVRTGAKALPMAINGSDVVVGSYLDDAGTRHAFIYQSGALSDLPFGTPSEALAINASGQILGRAGARTFVYDRGTFRDLATCGGAAMNDLAQVAGIGPGTGQPGCVEDTRSGAVTLEGIGGGLVAIGNSGLAIGDAEGSHGYLAQAGASLGNLGQIPAIAALQLTYVHGNAINGADWIAGSARRIDDEPSFLLKRGGA